MLNTRKNIKGLNSEEQTQPAIVKKNTKRKQTGTESKEVPELKSLVPYSEEDERTRFKEPSMMWPQQGKFATYYKYWMLFHSWLVALFYVFRISFEKKPVLGVVILEFYVDIVYLVDMVRIFRSPYTNENGKLVTDFKLIACRYLKTWFIPDLYSFIPLALIRYNSSREEGGYNDL